MSTINTQATVFAPAAVAELLELMDNLPDTASFTTQVCVCYLVRG